MCANNLLLSSPNSIPKKAQTGITFGVKLHGLKRFHAGEEPSFRPPFEIPDQWSLIFF
jgi:hypothetical protein